MGKKKIYAFVLSLAITGIAIAAVWWLTSSGNPKHILIAREVDLPNGKFQVLATDGTSENPLLDLELNSYATSIILYKNRVYFVSKDGYLSEYDLEEKKFSQRIPRASLQGEMMAQDFTISSDGKILVVSPCRLRGQCDIIGNATIEYHPLTTLVNMDGYRWYIQGGGIRGPSFGPQDLISLRRLNITPNLVEFKVMSKSGSTMQWHSVDINTHEIRKGEIIHLQGNQNMLGTLTTECRETSLVLAETIEGMPKILSIDGKLLADEVYYVGCRNEEL